MSGSQLEKLVDFLVRFVLALDGEETDIKWKVDEQAVTRLNDTIQRSTIKYCC